DFGLAGTAPSIDAAARDVRRDGAVPALAGIYSVIAQSVVQRHLEIAIRMALGASPDSVARLILSDGLLPGLAGMAAGVLASFALARVVSTMLFHVDPYDPITWV